LEPRLREPEKSESSDNPDDSYLVYREQTNSENYKNKLLWENIIERNKDKINYDKNSWKRKFGRVEHEEQNVKNIKKHEFDARRKRDTPDFSSRLPINFRENKPNRIQLSTFKLNMNQGDGLGQFVLGICPSENFINFRIKLKNFDQIRKLV